MLTQLNASENTVKIAEKPYALKFEKGQSVVFDGDSMTSRRRRSDGGTWPFIQLMGWDQTWADVFGQLVFCWQPELELKFSNSAIGGSNSRDILERIDRVTACKPQWVMLTIGGNDASSKIPLDEFQKNIQTYCDKLNQEGAKVVFMINDYCPSEAEKRYPGKIVHYQERVPYLDKIKEIASKHELVTYIDISDFMKSRIESLLAQSSEHSVLSDGGHYNNVGATIFAGSVLSAFNVLPNTEKPSPIVHKQSV